VKGPWSPGQARYFTLLKEFVRREKHARVPDSHREGNFPLGQWVGSQRLAYRRGRLTAEQIRHFEALPGWTWSPLDDNFQRGLLGLKAFVRREGHAAVPHAHREKDLKLGYWVAVRRRDYSERRLSAERIRALESVPGWWWRREDPFSKNLKLLRRFVAREGHARVPSKHREDGFFLGRWVEHMRRARAEGRLSRERARVLARLPRWAWHPREDFFPRGLRALETFSRREGHFRIPHAHVEAGVRLGLWVAKRRADYRSGRLSRDRVRALERLRGWSWDTRRDSFEAAFEKLLRFVKREGNARVPVDHVERSFPLGTWVHKRRSRRDLMSEEHRRRLAALPGWMWNAYESQFQEGLRLLRAFRRREGHALVPASHVEEEFHLGRWVTHLRSRKNEIAAERRRAVEAIRGWTWRVRKNRAADSSPRGNAQRRLGHSERRAVGRRLPDADPAKRDAGG
jgi:hypothetical protein